MKNPVSAIFSFLMIGLGVVLIFWAASSSVPRALSQTAAAPGAKATVTTLKTGESVEAPAAANAPGATLPAAGDQGLPAPSMDLPPGALPGAADAMVPNIASGPSPDTPPQGLPSQTEAGVAYSNPEGYTYDPTGRRDPFRPFGESQITTSIPAPIPIQPGIIPPVLEPPTPEPTEPLQQFDLAQLKVVGIIWEVRNPKAMIRDPLGKLHLVFRESKIGRNSGFIAAIREGEIVVVEPTVGEGGVRSAITRVMQLIR